MDKPLPNDPFPHPPIARDLSFVTLENLRHFETDPPQNYARNSDLGPLAAMQLPTPAVGNSYTPASATFTGLMSGHSLRRFAYQRARMRAVIGGYRLASCLP